ncbi:MAG: DUF484 family protein [Rhodospirillales bacterium]
MPQGKDDPAVSTLETADSRLSDDDVAEYLVAHPDFFRERLEVLSFMNMPGRFAQEGPRDGGQVVDFQQALLHQQKEAVEELRECVRDVIETSRSNMSVQQRTHAAVLAIMEAADFDALVRVISDDLPRLLDVDVVSVGYEPSDNPLGWLVSPEINDLGTGLVDALLGAGGAAKLYRDIADDGSVFGEAAGLVQSAAVARLRPSRATPVGLMALGSRSDSFFQPGQGTELVVFLARVLENCIDRLQERSM